MELENIVRQIVEKAVATLAQQPVCADPILVGVSNRHVHLCRADIDALFGAGYALTAKNQLSQPDEFAANETVLLAGPKGAIEKVRVLGPARTRTQVELLAGDLYKLGIAAPVRESGKLDDAGDVMIVGPKGAMAAQKCAIVAKRHIHMTADDAARFGVVNGQTVSVACGGERAAIFGEVVVRVSDSYRLELHLDTEEANAAGITNGDQVHMAGAAVGCCCGKCGDQDNESNKEQPDKELNLVTEADVKAAYLSGQSIRAGKSAIITALASDAAKGLGVSIIRA